MRSNITWLKFKCFIIIVMFITKKRGVISLLYNFFFPPYWKCKWQTVVIFVVRVCLHGWRMLWKENFKKINYVMFINMTLCFVISACSLLLFASAETKIAIFIQILIVSSILFLFSVMFSGFPIHNNRLTWLQCIQNFTRMSTPWFQHYII